MYHILFRRRPLRYLKIHSLRFQTFHSRLRSWKIYNRLERYTINSANKVAAHKWFQRIGRKIGTSSSDLTYGTIETIIIYNALLPICWAPINFVCAVTFIQFYRSFMNEGNDDDDNNDDNGPDRGSKKHINIKTEYTENDKHKMRMNQFLFSIKNNLLGIQPSTICMEIGRNHHQNKAIYDCFQSMPCH